MEEAPISSTGPATPADGLRSGLATIAREIGLRAAKRNPVSYYAVTADTTEFEPIYINPGLGV